MLCGAAIAASCLPGLQAYRKELAMTTLVNTGGVHGAATEHHAAPAGARALLDRLHEESDRQVPFSQAKLLLRAAASAIERLESDLARVTAELDVERAARQRGDGK